MAFRFNMDFVNYCDRCTAMQRQGRSDFNRSLVSQHCMFSHELRSGTESRNAREDESRATDSDRSLGRERKGQAWHHNEISDSSFTDVAELDGTWRASDVTALSGTLL